VTTSQTKRLAVAVVGTAVALLFASVVVFVRSRDAAEAQRSVVEVDLRIGQGASALPGTLTLPRGEGPWPSVVLVSGSGPQDRDGTIGVLKPFRDIAFGLAREGVASYRFDKRTKLHPTEFVGRSFTVQDEFVNDAVAAVRLLQGRDELDERRVFVLGHSQGGTVAPRIAMAEPSVAGLILLAASTEPLQQAIVRQAAYLNALDGVVTDAEQATLDTLQKRAATVESPELSERTPLGSTFGLPAAYWLDLRGYDPAAAAAEVNRPILVLQGDNDYQVPAESFVEFKRALARHGHATFHLYPGLTHAFVDGPATPAAYSRRGHVSAQVLQDMTTWVNSQPVSP
jgi:dienelactone hydrolase